ncbi:MAG: phosphate acetyltransferase [Planctomycetota bacterium]
MPRSLLLAPVADVDVLAIAAQLRDSAQAAGLSVAQVEPFATDRIGLAAAETAIAEDSFQMLLEQVVTMVRDAAQGAQLTLVCGVVPAARATIAAALNRAVAKAIDADALVLAGAATPGAVRAGIRAYDLLDPDRLVGVLADGELALGGINAPVHVGQVPAAALQAIAGSERESRLSPAMFRSKLIADAAVADKRIVLPEGDEPRTVEAAAVCQRRGVARCVLLGETGAVRAVAAERGVDIDGCEIIDPRSIAGDYVDALVELRKHKGMTAEKAAELLTDNVWVGTMMMKRGEVDGLVSGAVHSTANTIRPSLQVIKTKPGVSLVSSVFFMGLEDQVVVFGDCAVCTDPTAEQLSDIAIESGKTAAAFGIPPRVAMVSYSTKGSGDGPSVEKVTEATRLAQEKAQGQNLLVDGPLQYDAAAVPAVGAKKAPDSPVAGRATVYTFPDLNTGNCTYKAVQRSADIIAVGPMLQGMAMPVNDLSRGALVEDIVFTIALTAIQAANG